MAKNRLTRNLSANTMQLLINQVFGLGIFYALSRGLDKNMFGRINWSLAVLLTAFGILTLGIDQVMVKKIAAGYNRQSVFTAYLFHVIISGGIFYSLLLLSCLLFPAVFPHSSFILLIGAGKFFIFLSTPFKQLAAGLEKFSRLLFMSVTSNIIRGAALVLLLLFHSMSITKVMVIFIAGDLIELILCIVAAAPLLQQPFLQAPNKKLWYLLLRESLPQTGVIVCTAIMSRFDWIMIGMLLSSSKLAEYSFAWKVFEMATLPLLVFAPLMVPLFTRLCKKPGHITAVSFFLDWQIMIAAFIALLLNICWVPVIDFITDGKYGSVNTGTILVLSLSMPLLYFNNYLWTIHFTNGNLKRILFIMLVSLAVNISGCCILVPLYKNEGAALAYFSALLVQLIMYSRNSTLPLLPGRGYQLLVWPIAALASGFLARLLVTGIAGGIVTAVSIYLVIVLCSRQLRFKDWKKLQSIYQ